MKLIKVTPVFEKEDEDANNRKYISMLINTEHIAAIVVNVKTRHTEIIFDNTMIPVEETPNELEEMINGKGQR